MPNTDIRYSADPRKQNHYERWLAERKVQKEDSCGCAFCLEFATLGVDLRPNVGQAEGNGRTPQPVSQISPALNEAVATFSRRGRHKQAITADQQAILDRTDLTVRQKAELSGLPVSTVGRLTKRG